MNHNRIKIFFLIDSLSLGGAEKSLISLLNNFHDDKYDITLYRINPYGLLDSQVPSFVKKRILEIKSESFITNSIIFFGKLFYSLSLKCFKPKQHLAEKWWSYVGRHIPPLKKKYDIAIAYQQGFSTYFISKKVFADKKIAWVNADIKKVGYNPSFNRDFYHNFNHIITVSNSARETFLTEYPDTTGKVSTIFDIVDKNSILAQAGETSPYNDIPGSTKILTVGRLVKLKGYDIAIDAAKLLLEKNFNFHWYFLGEGPYREQLETRIAETGLQRHITLLGAKQNPYPYFKYCDIYVQPSYNEGYGIALYEAKIFARPIISTNFPSARDIIEDNVTGLISEMDGTAIFNCIMKLNDTKFRQAILDNFQKAREKDLQTQSITQIKLLFDR